MKNQRLMDWEEAKILRMLAVGALATAFLVMVIITASSGILSNNGDNSGAQALESPAGSESDGAGGDKDSDAEAPVEKTYVVEGGDSFYTIAKKFNTSISEIQKLNPDLDPSNLMPGTKVVIP